MLLPFFLPAELILWNCGSGRGEGTSAGEALRLIQIRLMCAVYAETGRACQCEFYDDVAGPSIKSFAFTALARTPRIPRDWWKNRIPKPEVNQ
jgi:hypothetical protein